MFRLSMEMLPDLSAKSVPRPSMEILLDLALHTTMDTFVSGKSDFYILTSPKIPTKSPFYFFFTKYHDFFLIRMLLDSLFVVAG